MFKRLNSLLLSLLLIGSAFVFTAQSASATTGASRQDRRTCVSLDEYRRIKAGATMAQVKALVDSSGVQEIRLDNSYYDGAYITDGYWDTTYVDDSYFDQDGNYVPAGHYEDTWVDTSYYDENGGAYHSVIDIVRSYTKCREWNRGRGRVGINFDNYSDGRTGLRAYSKRTDVNTYFARSGARSAGLNKAIPHHSK